MHTPFPPGPQDEVYNVLFFVSDLPTGSLELRSEAVRTLQLLPTCPWIPASLLAATQQPEPCQQLRLLLLGGQDDVYQPSKLLYTLQVQAGGAGAWGGVACLERVRPSLRVDRPLAACCCLCVAWSHGGVHTHMVASAPTLTGLPLPVRYACGPPADSARPHAPHFIRSATACLLLPVARPQALHGLMSLTSSGLLLPACFCLWPARRLCTASCSPPWTSSCRRKARRSSRGRPSNHTPGCPPPAAAPP